MKNRYYIHFIMCGVMLYKMVKITKRQYEEISNYYALDLVHHFNSEKTNRVYTYNMYIFDKQSKFVRFGFVLEHIKEVNE